MFTPTQPKGKEAKKQVEYSTLHKQAGRHAEEVTHVLENRKALLKEQAKKPRARL